MFFVGGVPEEVSGVPEEVVNLGGVPEEVGGVPEEVVTLGGVPEEVGGVPEEVVNLGGVPDGGEVVTTVGGVSEDGEREVSEREESGGLALAAEVTLPDVGAASLTAGVALLITADNVVRSAVRTGGRDSLSVICTSNGTPFTI